MASFPLNYWTLGFGRLVCLQYCIFSGAMFNVRCAIWRYWDESLRFIKVLRPTVCKRVPPYLHFTNDKINSLYSTAFEMIKMDDRVFSMNSSYFTWFAKRPPAVLLQSHHILIIRGQCHLFRISLLPLNSSQCISKADVHRFSPCRIWDDELQS